MSLVGYSDSESSGDEGLELIAEAAEANQSGKRKLDEETDSSRPEKRSRTETEPAASTPADTKPAVAVKSKVKLPSAASVLNSSTKPSFLASAPAKSVFEDSLLDDNKPEKATEAKAKTKEPEAEPAAQPPGRQPINAADLLARLEADRIQRKGPDGSKVRSFKQKEKRKRALGQLGRSSYNENEKRILRQMDQTSSVFGN